MNTTRRTASAKRKTGTTPWEIGRSVERRPRRSPRFQVRKPRGMKTFGWSKRGASSMGTTETILEANTGKNIATEKQRNTEAASQCSFL